MSGLGPIQEPGHLTVGSDAGHSSNATALHRDGSKRGSSWFLATMFVLGCVFPPFWWLGVSAGLQTGQDNECLIQRKKSLSPAAARAWFACSIMSVLSASALILVLAIHFGRPGPLQQGELQLVRIVLTDTIMQSDERSLSWLMRNCTASVMIPLQVLTTLPWLVPGWSSK